MGDKTAIEWADATWNPIRAKLKSNEKLGYHCERVNEACKLCYARDLNRWVGTGLDYKPGHRDDIHVFIDDNILGQPRRWKRGRRIFVCSMTDLFLDLHDFHMIDMVLAEAVDAPQHTYMILTKRPDRMRDYIRSIPERSKTFDCHSAFDDAEWPLPNVWLGVTACDQESADAFVPILLETPAAVRFVSYEPALGPVDWSRFIPDLDGPAELNLNLIIAGGESGHHARPANPQWFRDTRDQCAAAGVAFFFKQWGEWVSVSEVAGPGRHFSFPDGRTVRRTGKKIAGRLLDGRTHDEFPNPRSKELVTS